MPPEWVAVPHDTLVGDSLLGKGLLLLGWGGPLLVCLLPHLPGGLLGPCGTPQQPPCRVAPALIPRAHSHTVTPGGQGGGRGHQKQGKQHMPITPVSSAVPALPDGCPAGCVLGLGKG